MEEITSTNENFYGTLDTQRGLLNGEEADPAFTLNFKNSDDHKDTPLVKKSKDEIEIERLSKMQETSPMKGSGRYGSDTLAGLPALKKPITNKAYNSDEEPSPKSHHEPVGSNF